jgi:hypothetical protein
VDSFPCSSISGATWAIGPATVTEEQPGLRFALADCEADHPDGAETLPLKIALLHLAHVEIADCGVRSVAADGDQCSRTGPANEAAWAR